MTVNERNARGTLRFMLCVYVATQVCIVASCYKQEIRNCIEKVKQKVKLEE